MQENYSNIAAKEYAALIPGVAGSLNAAGVPDPAKIDSGIKAMMEREHQLLVSISKSKELQDFKVTQNPKALLPVFRTLDAANIIRRRFQILHNLNPHIQPKETGRQISEALGNQVALVQDSNRYYGIVGEALQSVLYKLTDEAKQAMLEAVPELAAFSSAIDRNRKLPRANALAMGAIDLNKVQEAQVKVIKATRGIGSEDEIKKNYAEGLSGMLRCQDELARASGFEDAGESTAVQHGMPLKLIDSMYAAIEARKDEIYKDMSEITKIVEEFGKDKEPPPKYSWDEAKDIVVSAYRNFDPELGAVAARAFNEGWVQVGPERMIMPFTVANASFAGAPRDAHPFMAMGFGGNKLDVIMLAHEMGHVIEGYVAGQHQNGFSIDATIMQIENFSHFGERLVEKEMLSRAGSDREQYRIKTLFLLNQVESLHAIEQLEFEKVMRALVKAKGDEAPSYDELNAAYNQTSRFLKSMSGDKHLELKDSMLTDHWVKQPAYSNVVYPVGRIMAGALLDAAEKDPGFKDRYRDAMTKGANMSATEFWDSMLGKGKAMEPEFMEKQVDQIAHKVHDLKEHLKKVARAEKQAGEEPQTSPAMHSAALVDPNLARLTIKQYDLGR